MIDADDPTAATSVGAPVAVSRRKVLREWTAVAAVLAIPICAMIATASPIPNPPSRKALNFAPLVNPVAEQQERETEKETRRAKKKRDSNETKTGPQDEEQPESAPEQRASQP
jgi:hypothetical protein